VLVIRHGCAGHKDDWEGPDAARPLDAAGVAQAAAFVPVLLTRPVRRIASSPTARCIDTVVPLAHARGLPVDEDPRLGRSTTGDELLVLVSRDESADAVLCTHGEVMQGALEALRGAGVPIAARNAGDDALLLAKGSGWDLTVEGGAVIALRHVYPDPDLTCADHATARSS
jgi:8-oxo-dGTP diphosphatase